MNIKNALVKILKEYVILEKLKDDFDVEPAKREDVALFVKRHYLKTFPAGIKRIYAIYQKHTEGRKMVGMIIYGVPFMTAPKFLEPEVNPREVLELKRLYIDDIGVKNLESFVISQSLGLLKQDEPTIKVVLTFADDIQGHVGGIYQATNAIYLGKSESGKHKYAYILRGNLKTIKAKLEPLTQPYPKKELPPQELKEEEVPKRIPSEMYHGTIESRANKAWKNGLAPVATKNYAWSAKGVYLTTNPEVAKHFGAAGNYPPEDMHGRTRRAVPFGLGGREDVVIITISTKGLDPRKFRVDPNAHDSLVYFGIIPAKNVVDWKKVEDTIHEISREDFAKSLGKIRQQPQGPEFSPVQMAMKARIKSRIQYARIRQDHISRGKCIHDENDAYEYSNKKKSLLCKNCIETRYEPKRSKAVFNRICPHCLTYNLYYIPKDDRMSTLCRSCDKRRVGKKL